MKTQWIMDQLLILARIPDSACLDVRILGPERDLDHRYFLSLGRYVDEFIQIVSFFPTKLIYSVLGILQSSSMLPSLLFVQNEQWHPHLPVYL